MSHTGNVGGFSGDSVSKKSYKNSTRKEMFRGFMNSLEGLGDEYLLRKAPVQLPKDAKELISKLLPYVVIVLFILDLPAVLAIFGISVATSFIAPVFSLVVLLTTAVIIVSCILKFMAINPLLHSAKRGWKYTFYAILLWMIASLLSGDIVSGIFGTLIAMYALFQVKEYFKH